MDGNAQSPRTTLEPLEANAVFEASCFWCERRHPAAHLLSVCPGCVEAARMERFPMGSLEMSGSYPLTDAAIDDMPSMASPGNYALGYMDDDRFTVFYVGRSDSDVKHCLRQWVGVPSRYDRDAHSGRAAWGVQRRELLSLDCSAPGRVDGEDSSYTRFAYSYAVSAEAAFAKEWRNFDYFGGSDGLDNATPPSRQPVAQWEHLEHAI